ncbi:MAG: hypothetical protein ACLP5H_30390 [Desulfomonilaceae bacterium]
MEPSYVSAIIILVALSFSGFVAFLAFSGSRRAKTAGESEASVYGFREWSEGFLR